MLKELFSALLFILFTISFTYFIGSESRLLSSTPLIYYLVAQSFLIQIIAYIPAAIFNTEMFFDLTGGLTFISITLVATYTNEKPCIQQYVSAGMIIIWAGRLGSFLFLRMLKKGFDSRFVEIKKSKI